MHATNHFRQGAKTRGGIDKGPPCPAQVRFPDFFFRPQSPPAETDSRANRRSKPAPAHLVADYDAAEVKWPKVKMTGVLEHLMAEQGMTAAELSRVLGASRNLGGMILRGERRLTLDHVTRLAKHFHVSPALFLEQ